MADNSKHARSMELYKWSLKLKDQLQTLEWLVVRPNLIEGGTQTASK